MYERIPEEAVREFMELVRQKQGIKLEYKDAEARAKHLLTLSSMAFFNDPLPKVFSNICKKDK